MNLLPQKHLVTLCMLLLLHTGVPLVAQEIDIERIRREKIEDILRIQDTRTIFDSKLKRFLSDSDPVIRIQATFACASLQDTATLSQLITNLEDESDLVQHNAAFAIGQTAISLSEQGRKDLEQELLTVRIPRTKAAARLIEELGKFGSITGLNDLMTRIGNFFPPEYHHALTMSIARFAIRGISSDDAVRYLLRFTHPREQTTWEVMYALQRTGRSLLIEQDLDNIALHYTHDDPLVRLNLATLLGKVQDPARSLEPLEKMASFDGDWRVRVNALKALSTFDLRGKPWYQTAFRRAMSDGNMYVRLTAIESFASTGLSRDVDEPALRETFDWLEAMAKNKDLEFDWHLQAASAFSLAKLEGQAALAHLPSSAYPQPLLQAAILEAWGETGSPLVLDSLLSYCSPPQYRLYRAALDGLSRLSVISRNPETVEKTYSAALAALEERDLAVVTTAASLLGDSLFRRSSSVVPLIRTLSSMRIPDDIEAMQEIISTLGKINDTRAMNILRAQLSQPDRSVIVAATTALEKITGQSWASSVPAWTQPLFTDFDFKYLRSLPDSIPAKIETAKGNINVILYKNAAPFTVMGILKLSTQRGFYRGLKFHRVVPTFVIQGGDPQGDGWGGPGFTFRSEFSDYTYGTGTIGIASAGKDTEGSQFFITQSPQPHLDGRYTIIGRVVSGMTAVNEILVDDRIYEFSPR
ncbi:MAG TPA: peptidylprolyl isomerase [Bacteroidota bacterium]